MKEFITALMLVLVTSVANAQTISGDPSIANPLQIITEQGVDYPVVYVAVPRPVDADGMSIAKPRLQDVVNIQGMEPGSHLRIHHPDGTNEVLFMPDVLGGVMDPCPSLDGTKVYYSVTDDTTKVRKVWEAPINIYSIDVTTKVVTQLTFSTEPGDFNLGACEVPGGRLIFTSSRNRLTSRSQMGQSNVNPRNIPVMQLFALQLDDPANTVEQVGYLNLRNALHPVLLMDGRIMWSSHENHGIRLNELWGLLATKPDGRTFEPLFSAMGNYWHQQTSSHFQGQAPNGRIGLVHYYPSKGSGFGTLYDFLPGRGFGPPEMVDNIQLSDVRMSVRYAFTPVSSLGPFDTEPNTRVLTPWATAKDKGTTPVVSHPSGAPDGMLVSSGLIDRDPIIQSDGSRRIMESGIYLIENSELTGSQDELKLVIDSLDYFEVQPKALLPWRDIYGVDPVEIPWLPDSREADGSLKTYGYVGTSGVYARESHHTSQQRNPREPPLPGEEGFLDETWIQGGDTILFDNSEIDRIRIVFQAPTPRDFETRGWWDVDGIERMGVIGEIPLRKFETDGSPILDSVGDPDTSFLAKIPADRSWTFQLLDRHGRVLTHAMTWHQVRPGEVRTDCRGCHAHHQPGIVFEGTVASQSDYNPVDLTKSMRYVEWFRDVKPILEKNGCIDCHSGENPAGEFVIDDELRGRGPRGNDNDGEHVLSFRSTQSYMLDRIIGLLPDEDQMPKDRDPLSPEEISTIATWIDLGMPLDRGKFFDGLPSEGDHPDVPDPPEPPKDGEVERLLEIIRLAQQKLDSAELEFILATNQLDDLKTKLDVIQTELDAAQARWADAKVNFDSVRTSLSEAQQKLDEAVPDLILNPIP